MTDKWKSEKALLKAHMAIPAAKKLEWLEQVRRFTSALPKKTLAIRKKLASPKCT